MHALSNVIVANNVGGLTQEDALQRVLARGLEIGTVIDLGSANGGWTSNMMRFVPGAHFHMIDAQPRWKPELEALVAQSDRLTFTSAAIAAEPGECYFYESPDNPYGGRAFDAEERDDLAKVPAVSVDSEVERLDLRGPYAIKFDIHGLEERVLEGAGRTLQQTDLIIMEMLMYAEEGRRLPNLMLHLDALGFRCIDMAEPMFRPFDGALWQFDMFFVPRDRPEAAYPQFF